jgi:sialate O-acetylesterase
MQRHFKIAYTFFFFLMAGLVANAQIKLPKVIGDNMILQRNQIIPVWGWATQGQQVTVKFAGQQKTAIADENGYWKINLSALKASGQSAQMEIRSAGRDTVLHNILVGEVWLCSGQSNMEYPMKGGYSGKPPVKSADSAALDLSENNPNIHLFTVKRDLNQPEMVTTGWQECKGEPLAQFSAAGYFFAKNLQRKLNVPVGMIFSAWGGTQIEPWTPETAYLKMSAFKGDAGKFPNIAKGFEPGKLYHRMIEPLAPFGIKGFLWYQGESNAVIEDGIHYADKMEALIGGWRELWQNNKLPFYEVMLAPHYYTHRHDPLTHTTETLPNIWEAQTGALTIPYTDIISTTDLVDDLEDIHPSYKWEVGRRLALLALNKSYGYKQIEFSGPRFKSMQVKGNSIILSFSHAQGLKTSDGKEVNWFAVSGKDGQFKAAKAEIRGNKVILSTTDVTSPTNVRLGWNELAEPNLVNKAGLPAVPFRTDNIKWDYKTHNKQ